ncbi:retrotransposon protein, putative, ty1-copia subclass [Tanacetum coccineum]
MPVTTTASNAPGKSSYANITGKPSGKKVNVHTLFTSRGNGIDVVVPVDSIRAISERFANTAYGFFFGKKVAYPVVAKYVRNTWGKYGLVRSMFSSSTRLFSFQFSFMDRLDAMLENGPWFIGNNPLILKKWHPNENLLTEDVSTVPVWVKLHGVLVTTFSEYSLSAITTKLGTPLMLDSYTSDICMQSWSSSSYARVMIELRADVELKYNIVMAMPKITREGHYTCNVCVEYEWKPPRCSSCKVFRHIHEECPKNTGAGEKKTVKKPSQTSRGAPSTASPIGNKKKGVEPTIEVSNSNPFDVLNSVDNDVDSGTTSIIEKIGKFEDLLTSGQVVLVDKAGNPLKKVKFAGEYKSEDEFASVDNDMDRSIAYERVGFGSQSLLEQWRDWYGNGDYDDDPYDDDIYEGQYLSHELQAICDNLDICVRVLKLQNAKDLQGDALLHYDAEIELMNLILLSIPNDVYNSVDVFTSAKDMWKRVERLMRGTIQNKVDRETRFTNEFDQFVAELGEALQFEKLVNVSRAKKLEKYHDPLALVAHTGSYSRNISSYYVTHPTSVVDYDDEYQQDDVHTNSEDPLASAMLLLARAITQKFSNPTNNRLRNSSNTRNQAIIQGDRVNIQSRNSGNAGKA